MRESSNFIRNIMIDDLANNVVDGIVTRFPPEPNGLLHIGHVKALTINFDLAEEFGGYTYLRFDDTNPEKEEEQFVKLIQEDIKWLGFEPVEVRYASDYFEEMYERAVILIKKGLAYVDDTSPEDMRAQRGTLTEPGTESPRRNRSVEENLDLFARMRAGEFEEGSVVLRAKIDMASPNMNLRDPVIYRILHELHYRTGSKWHIYPMYDFAHPLEDYVERITHSLCSLEFENNRPLYDWYIDNTDVEFKPRQFEFARLNIAGAVIGKRHIIRLVEKGLIDGWDDPRLLTVSGMRRRGYTPEGIKAFIRETGVSKENSVTEFHQLEHFIREDLKLKAPRIMAVLDPVKVVITNWDKGVEWLPAENNVENPQLGEREMPFGRELYIEREDFMEVPAKRFRRLSLGNEVRLKYGYFIKANEVVKDEDGNILEIHCTYDPETKSGSGFEGRKPKGTIHWVEANHAVEAKVLRYDQLLKEDSLDSERPLEEQVNPESVKEFRAFIEPVVKDVQPFDRFQFYRHGYFSVDPNHTEELTFNEVVSMKSSYRP
ncbi:MAG: glutamine--tRNA ligase/YqeY domain fusion protein [Tissierellia bacterium]|nr:glutamine--tRNA ligase/YqeY domain fusion protein [Bacillota bacterium]NLL22359.1 glutamine--tRNA ligase/YqeY domain fusion protein [Tissierellia bacterium]